MIEIFDKFEGVLQAILSAMIVSVSFTKNSSKNGDENDLAPGDNFPHVFIR